MLYKKSEFERSVSFFNLFIAIEAVGMGYGWQWKYITQSVH